MSDIAAAGEAAGLRIQLLGGFRAWVGGREVGEAAWRRRKARSLVKLLALAPGHRLHREQLLEALWPDLDPEAAANNLRHDLHLARRALEPDTTRSSRYLSLQDELVVLCPDVPLWIDVDAFESAPTAARRTADPAAYDAALHLYTGDLLPEDRYEDWAAARRDDLRGTYLALLVELASIREARGEPQQAMEALQQVAAVEPAHEEAHVGLMRLFALVGQRHRALHQYQRLREAARRELDAEPGPDSQQLYQDILTGRFAPVASLPPSPPQGDRQRPPPPALAGDTVSLPLADAVASLGPRHNLPAQLTSFIGREQALGEVKQLLTRARLVTLTGPGGCGKTRLALEVAADLVDEHADGVWLVELAAVLDPVLVPQSVMAVLSAVGVREQPTRALMATLADALRARRLLLVLDNCEHLVAAGAQLAEGLLRACPHLRILATSRESLGVGGEIVWSIPSLAVPGPVAGSTAFRSPSNWPRHG